MTIEWNGQDGTEDSSDGWDGMGRDGMVGTMEGMVDIITAGGFVANLGRDRERRPDLSDDGRYLDTVSACLSPLGTS